MRIPWGMEIWRLLLNDDAENGAASPCDAKPHPVFVSHSAAEAVLLDANPLNASGITLPTGVPAVVCRSGWLEPDSDDEADRADAARRTWSGEGRIRFEAAWDSLRATAESRGVGLWLLPHAGDVIGDVPALRSLAGHDGGVELLLEPSAMLTESMIPEAGDHFDRLLEPLESGDLVRAVLVTNTDGVGRVPIGEGRIDPDILLSLAERVSAWAPVCVLAGDEALVAASRDRA